MINLQSVTEKGGRTFAVGTKDRGGNLVYKIIKVGNYVTIYLGANERRLNHILKHVDDLEVMS